MNVITLDNGFYVKGHGLLPKIKSLSRDNNRCYWSVNGTNDNGKYRKVFCDATYGSAYNSYKEAVRTIRRLSFLSKPSNNTVIVERKNKLVPHREALKKEGKSSKEVEALAVWRKGLV